MKSLAKIVFYIVIFLILAISSSYVTFRVMGAKKTVTVPDLKGMSLIEANKEILTKKLYLRIEAEDFSSEILAGNIIRQDVPPSEKIKEGRTIRVIVSKGPKRLYMPSFVGFNVDEARNLALRKNIKIEQMIRVRSDTVEKDIIISQRPTPEEKGADTIMLLVSEGPFEKLYLCPDFTEMTLTEAKDLSAKMGMEIELTGSGSNIIEQKPKPGSFIKKGDIIRLKLEYKEDQQLRWL
jgi:serine/threonine-protein kinase